MPTFRADLAGLAPYEAGRPIEEVARAYGVEDLVKLASNESPYPPFPEVQRVISEAAAGVHRYPDNNWWELRQALSSRLKVAPDQLWFGGGTSELLRVIALATALPGASSVYSWPSFVIYRLAGMLARSHRIEVPLTADLRHDLEAMAAALRADTTVAFVANPNNPTGTYVGRDPLYTFVESVPERVLVVVDEAYHDFVTASDYASALPLALERPNVVVTRTFSKVYGLAGLRVGYAVSRAENLLELRKAQAPFTVSSLAQAAAVEALRHPDLVAERARLNAEGRELLSKELTARAIEHADSQANFVYLRIGPDSQASFDDLVHEGVIVRAFEHGWIRVTVGTEEENRRFIEGLDRLLS